MSKYKLNKPSPNHSNGTGYITRSGHTMFNEDIISDLNRNEFLEKENKKLRALLDSIELIAGRICPYSEDYQTARDVYKINLILKESK